MATAFHLPAANPIENILARFTREQIEDFVEVAIGFLDAVNDPDVEPNGDELDGSLGEDDFIEQRSKDWNAGCPISDPGEDDGQDVCEAGDHGGGFVVLGHRSGWGADHDEADNENWDQPVHLN